METVPGVNPRSSAWTTTRWTRTRTPPLVLRGEFEVVKELMAALGDEGVASKRECRDKVIDKMAPRPQGHRHQAAEGRTLPSPS